MSYGTKKKKLQTEQVFNDKVEELKSGPVEEEATVLSPSTIPVAEPEEETVLPLDVKPDDAEDESPF